MKRVLNFHTVRGLAIGIAIILAAPPVSAKGVGVWRDAFQSSPAEYEPIPPDVAKRITEQLKLPPQVMEMMRPKAASGTVRLRFAVSAGGTQLRLRFSNEEGTTPLVLSAASVGLAADGFDAKPGTLRPVSFGDKRGITLPPGTPMLSDPIDLPLAPGTELVASLYVPGTLQLKPQGGAAMAVAAGDQTLRDGMTGVTRMSGRPLVTGAAVLTPNAPRVIVTLGDSITDGNRAKLGELRGWPEQLARRLAARKTGHGYAVVNAGIGGNRVLASGWGQSALARLDRDVLRVDGVSHVLVLEGTNDIGMSGASLFGNNPAITADDLIMGYRQIIARAHARGIKVVLATITPFGGSFSHGSPEKEAIRAAANNWIRTAREADAVIDFDWAARDPAAPTMMRKEFASADHLHPGEAGYKAMGDAIDLSIFD